MANIRWADKGSPASILTTELNAAASGARVLSTTVFDNRTNRDTQAWFKLVLASWTPSSGGYLSGWLLPSEDGSTFHEASTSYDPPATFLVIRVPLIAAAGARTLYVPNVPVGPFAYKLMLKNNSGATLAAAGNAVSIGSYKVEVV